MHSAMQLSSVKASILNRGQVVVQGRYLESQVAGPKFRGHHEPGSGSTTPPVMRVGATRKRQSQQQHIALRKRYLHKAHH
jgi:hypothetical protein